MDLKEFFRETDGGPHVEKMRASGVLWRDDHYQSAKEGIARDREKAWRRPRGECHPYVPCPPIR